MVEECVELKVGSRLEQSGHLSGATNNERIEKIEEREFLEARRAMKIWPVKAEDNELELECRRFLKETLEIPPDTAEQICIESVRKVRQARCSKISDEILVKICLIEERDIVQSYAPNLGRVNGTAGIRMEVPAHLRSTFRLLEAHGN